MRRSVVTAMSGISVAVVGLSLRGSNLPSRASLAAAPAGIVQAASPSPFSSPSSSPTGSASPAATAVRTRDPATGTAVVRKAPRVVVTQAPRPSPTATTVTVNGAPADTRYGPVQVQITITNGRITRVDAIDYPQGGGRDQEINSQAIPQLDQETMQAQSARIDTVSGATYTSDGYRQSLQSALDAAHAR